MDLEGIGIARIVENTEFPAEYVQALLSGNTYVNVQTRRYPDGEIRGQLLLPDGTVGDLNCDGVVDALDIEPFIVALFDPELYVDLYDCDINNADINGDGEIDALDIEPFIELLFGP